MHGSNISKAKGTLGRLRTNQASPIACRRPLLVAGARGRCKPEASAGFYRSGYPFPPGGTEHTHTRGPHFPHLSVQGFEVVGGITSGLGIEIGADVLAARKPPPAFVGHWVVPVVIGTIRLRIAVPAVIKRDHPGRDLALLGWGCESKSRRCNGCLPWHRTFEKFWPPPCAGHSRPGDTRAPAQ